MKEIAPDVYVESRYHGVTVGAVVTGDGVICVDSPMLPADARDWESRLVALAHQPVRYVIYTDAHRDRVLGSQYLGGSVIAHESAYEILKGYGDAFRQQTADSLTHGQPEAAMEIVTQLHIILPQITLTHQLTLYRGSTPVVLTHVGGPTPSSLWVTLPEQNVMFVGDMITVNTHPFLAEADLDVWIDLLKPFDKKKPGLAVVPGRGGVTYARSDVKRLYNYLLAVRRRVRRIARSGRSRANVNLLVQELLPHFPVPEGEREHIQRRIKAGLDHVYDFYRST